MRRKYFITSLLTSAVALKVTGLQSSTRQSADSAALKIPPYLVPGDVIGISAPAGYISPEEIAPAVSRIKEWGFQVAIGKTIGKREGTFGGSDEERRLDMQEMMDDKNIKAILCARGGYGIVRIIDQLSYKKLSAHPKWLIGFSDITVMHSHLHANYNIASLHSKMCNSFPSDWNLAEPIQKDTIESIRQCLTGEKMRYQSVVNANNRNGIGTGQLVGGNLKSLESLAGSRSDINTNGKILFVEDTGEYLYSLDRMFWNLKRSGKLDKLKGLVIGGFKVKKDDAGEEFGKSLEQIVLEKTIEYNYPICFDFPVGHQKNNYALKCGMLHTLNVSPGFVYLQEV